MLGTLVQTEGLHCINVMLDSMTPAVNMRARLRREVPREPLLLVIRSFGGAVAWAGQGSPLDEADESITHQACHSIQLGNRCPTGSIDDLHVSPDKA